MDNVYDGDQQYTTVDDSKKRRMISNRESARRSRIRKQQHLEGLLSEVNQFQSDNKRLSQTIEEFAKKFVEIESENEILRADFFGFCGRLQSLKSVLEVVEEVVGFSVNIPEIPESLQNPWQLPPLQLITASSYSTFQN